MSPQLSFRFTDQLTYSSDAFVVHGGVMHIADSLVTLVSERRFAVLFVHGETGTGKTHLGVYCAGLIRGLGRAVRIIRGDDIAPWLQAQSHGQQGAEGEVLFIDDAHDWLETKGCEALFTALADRVLHAKGLMVLFSARPVEDLRLSAQVKSRLTAGLQLPIGPTEERHLDAILRTMAKQRGLQLTPAKRSFILTRVPRTVKGLSSYCTRLEQVSRNAPSSTSMKVLTEAAEGF